MTGCYPACRPGAHAFACPNRYAAMETPAPPARETRPRWVVERRRPDLEAQGWDWLGTADPWHFTYRGGGPVRGDLGRLSVRAFQALHNRHAEGERLVEDGIFGPRTRIALKAAPAAGWK